MVDLATLALTHALMMLALIRMLRRDELDHEDGERGKRRPWLGRSGEAAD